MCHCIRRTTPHVDANVMEIALNHTTTSCLVKPHSHNGVPVVNAAPSSRRGCALLGDRFIPTWLESYLARLLLLRNFFLTINSSHQQPWHPSSWLMQPLRPVFSFDHLPSALFGPSTSLNGPSLADPRCHRFSAPDHTQTLLPLPLLPFQNPPALLPLLPFQNPPALLRARNLLGLKIRAGSPLRPWVRPGS
jgi:hypothetical protein